MEELPELPKPTTGYYYSAEHGENRNTAFTADQMREYARQAVLADRARALLAPHEKVITSLRPQPTLADAIRDAVLAERERCAKLCDAVDAQEQQDSPYYGFAKACAAAIRSSGE